MSKTIQRSSVVAGRYVRALIDLGEGAKAIPAIEADFADLRAMVEGAEDLQALIRSPLIGKDQQLAVVDALAKKAKFHDLTTNFLKVLVQNRRLNILPGALNAFEGEIAKRRGAVRVVVETAQDLTVKQIKALGDALKSEIGSDVQIHAQTDPDILGGMIVTIGSHMIDDSVRRKLERLRAAMGVGANENIELKQVS
ncbi:MAG: F0F1 ATP synthase subunit delta [Bdellovibrionales bacterium]